MTGRYDALIVGGGHNGLVCAFYLARAGLKVRVLERRAVVGGGSRRAPSYARPMIEEFTRRPPWVKWLPAMMLTAISDGILLPM